MTAFAYAHKTIGRPRPLLIRVCLLSSFLGLLELVGLLSFPALMTAVGWGGETVLARLPNWLAGWIQQIGQLGSLAIALPILAFAIVGSLQHLRLQQETRLMLTWHESLFRDCLHGMLGGRFPALAQMAEHDAAHILSIQTDRAATALALGLRLVLQGMLLVVQLIVACLVFGWVALWGGLLLAASAFLFLLLRRRWVRMGEDWSDYSEELFDRVLSGLRGWDTILTDQRCEEWLDGFHGHLKNYIDMTVRLYGSLEKTSALVNAAGATICLALILGAYSLGTTGGTLMMLGVLTYRALPQFKSWLRACQEFIQHWPAFLAVLGWAEKVGESQSALHPEPLLPMSFEKIDFAYKGAEPVLKDLTLTLPTTGLIGISGPNGCGKTTLLRILAHLLPAENGRWTSLDVDCPVEAMPDYRDQVSYLSATPLVWGETLGEFLEINSADSLAAELVERLFQQDPQKLLSLDTSEWGRSLSMGTRQKVAILRCLSKDRALTCMDEPTQHLDQAARQGLYDALLARARTAVVLVVSQDQTLLSKCEKRYQLLDGQLVAH